MPPLRLTSLLEAALPDLSATSQAVVRTLACHNGAAPLAEDFAALVGEGDRFRLARALRRDGLPPLTELAGWTRVLYWMLESETTGRSLLQLAQREHVDPAVAYRLVRRLTGLRWSEARRSGPALALGRLQAARRWRPTGAEAPRPGAAITVKETGAASARSLRPSGRADTATHPAGLLPTRLAVGDAPFDVAVGPDGLCYVTRVNAAAVECLELEPFHSIGSIRVGAAPTRVAVDASGTRAYVTAQFTDAVAIVDLARRCRVGAIPVPGDPLGAVLAADGHTLYVVTNQDRVCALSLYHRRVTVSAAIPLACAGLAIHPSGRWVYVPTWRAGLILEVNGRTLHQSRRFAVGGASQDLVVSSDGLMLYAANQQGWLDAIHLGTGRQLGRLPLGGPAFGVALSPDEAVLYVGLLDGRLAVVDRAAFARVKTLVLGGRPRRIAFAAGGRAAVIANGQGWVDVVR
jgi:DNA-binding beta-propeller fold protein YncE